MRFILCSPRSGSTLLSRILDTHPEIACPFEFMIPYLIPPLHWKRRQAKAKLRRILRHYGIRVPLTWQWTGIPLKKHLETVVKGICDGERKRIFVAKDPFYARILERVVRRFPGSKYIVLSRHPLKVAQSIQDTWHNDKGLMMWAIHYEGILKHEDQIDHTIVKYEDLVSRPRQVVKSICDHIGVEFTPEMLDYSRHTHTGDELNLRSVTTPRDRITRTLKSVKKGRIDSSIAELDLDAIDNKYKVQYGKNAYGSREIAEVLGYGLPS